MISGIFFCGILSFYFELEVRVIFLMSYELAWVERDIFLLGVISLSSCWGFLLVVLAPS